MCVSVFMVYVVVVCSVKYIFLFICVSQAILFMNTPVCFTYQIWKANWAGDCFLPQVSHCCPT